MTISNTFLLPSVLHLGAIEDAIIALFRFHTLVTAASLISTEPNFDILVNKMCIRPIPKMSNVTSLELPQ